jgi:two-component sensor histidine kinase
MMLLSLAKCYAAVNNKESARSYCEELIGFLELIVKRKETSSDFPTFEFWADEFLSSFYLDDAQYSKAEIYFKKALALWETTSKESSVLFRNRFLFKLDSARGNYISAIRHLQTLQLQNDSIYNVTKSKQIEELKINYATEQKDSIINLKEQNIKLLTQQDQFQKSKLQQEALLRNISFAIATLLIIIVALLYNRYRLKQRTNKKLELQQEEIARKNLSLQNLVKEKDWLVKEIHHRVKNNLQIVMSLLNSQSAYINNERALTAIHDSQHRVHAMSLIHQKLYNTENVSSIDISLYIREMVSYLSESFNTGQRIRFEYDIKPLEMDVSQAVPLGLILNEAITNSIKYAFPDDRSGVISISLSDTSPNQCLLVMSDNGVGMPQQFDSKKPGSLGMSLMEGLSEDLDGKFSIENKNGTTIKVSFAHDVNVKRPEVFAPLIVSNY